METRRLKTRSGMRGHLVQILLPLHDGEGRRLGREPFDTVARELTERFGGLTAYARAPAAGLWEEKPGKTERDDIVVYEVMVENLDPRWWAGYRNELEKRFDQDELVVRAHEIARL
jgi:hypothetical protein